MSYDPTARSPEQDAVLDAIVATGRPGAVAVFDVDGCLFDTRWRTLHILAAWAQQIGDERPLLARAEHFWDRDLGATLHRAGVPRQDVDAWMPALRPFWEERFFDDDHVERDAVMPGAAAIVRAVYERGSRIVYLTGRHLSQRPANEQAFRREGFPLDDRAVFVDKLEPRMEDHIHKQGALDAIAAMGDVALSVENEPFNARFLLERFPDALHVLVQTDHSGRPVVPDPRLRRIRGWLRTTES